VFYFSLAMATTYCALVMNQVGQLGKYRDPQVLACSWVCFAMMFVLATLQFFHYNLNILKGVLRSFEFWFLMSNGATGLVGAIALFYSDPQKYGGLLKDSRVIVLLGFTFLLMPCCTLDAAPQSLRRATLPNLIIATLNLIILYFGLGTWIDITDREIAVLHLGSLRDFVKARMLTIFAFTLKYIVKVALLPQECIILKMPIKVTDWESKKRQIPRERDQENALENDYPSHFLSEKNVD